MESRSENSGGFLFWCLVDVLVFFGVPAEAATAFFCPPPAFFAIGADEDGENGFIEVFAMSGQGQRRRGG